MTAVTPEGFVGKRLPQLKGELEAAFREQFGADLNIAPETVVGQLIGIESEARAVTWADLEDVYQSQYPLTATGVSLDRVVDLNGIERLPARPTAVQAVLLMTPATVLTAGRKARNGQELYTLQGQVTATADAAHGAVVTVGAVQNATEYRITVGGADYTITSDSDATGQEILTALQAALPGGFVTVLTTTALRFSFAGPQSVAVSANLAIQSLEMVGQFQADEPGPSVLPVGALNQIETPVAGWLSVVNRVSGTMGRARETDPELRIRRERSVRLQAVGTLDGISANIRQLPGVLDVAARENSGTVTDGDGVPPQHLWIIVEGGAAADIARAIYTRKAGGIGTFGSEVEQVTSEETGQQFAIRFDRPDITPVYIRVTIQASPLLPADYVARVRQALVQYGETLGIGDPIIRNRLFTPAGAALDAASFIDEVLLDVSSPPAGTSNLIAATDERFQIIAGNIDVLLA
jgi:uncharacterized phage protein gp47/JayE